MRRTHAVRTNLHLIISIHAPLSGVRPKAELPLNLPVSISIHAPLSGVRLIRKSASRSRREHFNPRTPERGATRLHRDGAPARHFNPRTPERGATANMHNSARCFSGNLSKNMHICSHGHFSATGIAAENTAITCFRRCEAPGKTMFIPGSHRIKASAAPPAHRSAWRRHARRDSDNCCRGCRSADYPSPGQSAPQGDA